MTSRQPQPSGTHAGSAETAVASVVDVCIPTIARDRYLAEAIESVLAQTYEHWTLTISFDGLPDPRAEAMVEPYLGDERVRLRATSEKVGAARNITALLCSGEGEYVLILHDDDRLRPRALAHKVEFLERHPDCGMVFGPHRDIDREGRVLGQSPLPYAPGVLDRAAWMRDVALANPVAAMHAALVRRSALERSGCYADAAFPRLYDWDLWTRLACVTTVGYLDQEDAEYRLHGEQVSTERRSAAEWLAVFERGERFAAESGNGSRLSPPEHRRRLSQLHVSMALDGVERGERSAALAWLRSAVRLRPAAVAHPRFLVGLAGMLAGPAGPRMLAAGRVRGQTRAHARASERRR